MQRSQALILLVLGACGNAAPSPPTPSPPPLPPPLAKLADARPPDAAPVIDPEVRARAFVQRQIELGRAAGDAGTGAPTIHDTLTPDALVVDHSFHMSHTGADDLGAAFSLRGGPDGVQIESAKLGALVVRGNDDVVGFIADIAMTTTGPGASKPMPSTVRVLEVIAASAGWRAVAVVWDAGGVIQPGGDDDAVPGATTAGGPLVRLLLAPGTQLAPGALTLGPGGKPFVPGTEPLVMAKPARVTTTPTWALVTASLTHRDGKYTDGVFGLALAVPTTDHGWRVLVESYDGT